jgi:tRNA threonylcarbamoyladenosine biosynthesis protein TsaB
MQILGFDSAGAGASAAVLRDGAIVAARATMQERGQAEILLPMIATVLEEAGTEATALDAIGVATGPGSFTGLRIAIAAARGLALAAGVPAIGISRFAAIAARFPPSRRDGRALLIALDTKRDDFFLQLFRQDAEEEPVLADGYMALRLLPAMPLLAVGDGARGLAAALAGRDIVVAEDAEGPCAESVARLAAAALASGAPVPPPRPLYLRAPDTTQPRVTVPR